MRVWLIGAGKEGTEALRQLQKNDEIEVVVTAHAADPQAVREGVIERVDHVEVVTPVNFAALARRMRPDLILIDSTAQGGGLGRVTGGATLTEGLIYEMAATSDYPCLIL